MSTFHAVKWDYRETLTRLRFDADALPWDERRELAESLAAALATGSDAEHTLSLLRFLAGDSRWEVRKAVAEILPSVPDTEFGRVSGLLLADENPRVRLAAEHAIATCSAPHDRRSRRTESPQAIAAQQFNLLVGATAHNLRGAILPIKDTIDRLLSRLNLAAADPLLRDCLPDLRQQTSFAIRMIDELRAYARPVAPDCRPENALVLVREAWSMVQRELAARRERRENANLRITLGKALRVQVDRSLMLTVLFNLLQNAVDAFEGCESGADRRIEVTAREITAKSVAIDIADTGAGICSDTLHEIQRFVPGTTTKAGHGTGLGLPIAAKYVAAQGGRLEIDSTWGVGTRVTLTLPLSAS